MKLTATSPAFAQAASTPRSASLRFAGGASAIPGDLFNRVKLASAGGLTKVFQPVIEVFFWGIMAIDIVALWIPRIWTALTQGAMDYDPQTDPKNQGQSTWTVLKNTTKERWKRLNWLNGLEETGREAASGPAIFVWPSIVFAVARRMKYGNAIELGWDPLHRLTTGFADYAKQHPIGASKEAYKAGMKGYLTQLLHDPDMSKVQPKSGTHTTYQAWLENWVDRLVNSQFDAERPGLFNFKAKGALQKQADQLAGELGELVTGFNYAHNAKARFYNYEKLAWATTNPLTQKLDKGLIEHGVLFNHLNRWGDFARHVMNKALKNPGKPLPELLNSTRQWLGVSKLAFGAISTVATLAFLFKIVTWTQSHDKYPANRLIDRDILDKLAREGKLPADFNIENAASPTPEAPQPAIPYGVSFSPYVTPYFPQNPYSPYWGYAPTRGGGQSA